ncbi:MAG: hypothetical protein ACTSRZ_16445 [Promethearchaeota archaeon]
MNESNDLESINPNSNTQSIEQLVSDQDCDYIYELVKKICTEIGPGCPCSKQEYQRAMIFKEELDKIADKVDVEKFKCAPRAFLGWYKLGGILATICLALFYLTYFGFDPIISSGIGLAIASIIFLMMTFEFFLSKEFIDFLYKEGESENIIGFIYSSDLKEKKAADKEDIPHKIIIYTDIMIALFNLIG